MTREEAIKTLKANVMVACDTSDKVGYDTPLNKAIEQALEMAIKALEKEPCNDCVSRKKLMDNYNSVETPVGYRKVVDIEVIKNMQSVRPIHNKAKWIKQYKAFVNDDNQIVTECHCNNCYGISYFRSMNGELVGAKYCPNCGAEMDYVELDYVFDNVVKEMTHEERVLIELTRDMPKEMGVLYIESFQQEHGPFSDDAAELIRKYLSKE